MALIPIYQSWMDKLGAYMAGQNIIGSLSSAPSINLIGPLHRSLVQEQFAEEHFEERLRRKFEAIREEERDVHG